MASATLDPDDRPEATAADPPVPPGGQLAEGSLGQTLGYQIALASTATNRVFVRHIGEPMQLKPVEFSILMLLLANQGVTAKRLGQTLALSAPNLTVLLDRLQQADWVTRVTSPSDRRSMHILLTAEGRALALRAERAASTMEDELLQVLSAAEKAMLIELLHRVSASRQKPMP